MVNGKRTALMMRVLTSMMTCVALAAAAVGLVRIPVANGMGESQTYLPLITKSALELYGYVTENGVPVAGVQVDLLYSPVGNCSMDYYPSNFVTSIVTDNQGLYNFTHVATLPPGSTGGQPCYATAYHNREANPQRLATWLNRSIWPYTQGDAVLAGNFDVADISRVNPVDGAVLPQPPGVYSVTLSFDWIPRPIPSDNYFLDLVGVYGSVSLGNTGHYERTFSYNCIVCPLPRLYPGPSYTWRLLVSNSSGGGYTFQSAFTVPVQ
jgi:hypothetical protein